MDVLQWDEAKVNKWISSIGYPLYERRFREQGITGDVLVNLNHDTLKDLQVHSVGERLDILNNIYQLKSSARLPLNDWDYVPPSAIHENSYLGPNGIVDYRKIEAAFHERDTQLKRVTEEMNHLRLELAQLRKQSKDKPLPPVDRAPISSSGRLNGKQLVGDGGTIKIEQESASKNVRLLENDSCGKVIQSALRKFQGNPGDWNQYDLWIQYHPTDSIATKCERALTIEERPLQLLKTLKDEGKSPTFVLKEKSRPLSETFIDPETKELFSRWRELNFHQT